MNIVNILCFTFYKSYFPTIDSGSKFSSEKWEFVSLMLQEITYVTNEFTVSLLVRFVLIFCFIDMLHVCKDTPY